MKKTTKKILSAVLTLAMMASAVTTVFADSIVVTKDARLYAETFDGFNGSNSTNLQTTFSTTNAGSLYNGNFMPGMVCLNTNEAEVAMKSELAVPVNAGVVEVEFDYIPAYWNIANVTGSRNDTVFSFVGGEKTFSFTHELNVGNTSNVAQSAAFKIGGSTVSNKSSLGNFFAWNYGIRDDVNYVGNHIKVAFDFDAKKAQVTIGKNESNTGYVPVTEYTTIFDDEVDFDLDSLEYIEISTVATATSAAKITYYNGVDNIYVDTKGEAEHITATAPEADEPEMVTETVYSEDFEGFNGSNPTNPNTTFNTVNAGNLYNGGFLPGMVCLNTNEAAVSMRATLDAPVNSGIAEIEFDYIPAYWNAAGVTGSKGDTVFSFVGGGKTFSFSHELNVGNTANATSNVNFNIGDSTVANTSSTGVFYAWNYGIREDVGYVGNHAKVTFDFDNNTAHVTIGKTESNTGYIPSGTYTTIFDEDVEFDLESLEYMEITNGATATSAAKINYYNGVDNVVVNVTGAATAEKVTKTLYAEDFTAFNGSNPSNANTTIGGVANATDVVNNSFLPNMVTLLNGNKTTHWLNSAMSEAVTEGIVELQFDFIPQYWPGAAETNTTTFEVNNGEESYSFDYVLASNSSLGSGTAYFAVEDDVINTRATGMANFINWGTRLGGNNRYLAERVNLTLDLDNGTGHIAISQTDWVDTAYLPPVNAEYSVIYESDIETGLNSFENFKITSSATSGAFYMGVDNISVIQEVEVESGDVKEGTVNEDKSGEVYDSAAVDTVYAIDEFSGDEYLLEDVTEVSCHVNKIEAQYTSPMSAKGITTNIAVKDENGKNVPVVVNLDVDKFIIEFENQLTPGTTYTLYLEEGLKTVSGSKVGVNNEYVFETATGTLDYSEFTFTDNNNAITTIAQFKAAEAPTIYYKGGNFTGDAAETVLILAYYNGNQLVEVSSVPYEFEEDYTVFTYVETLREKCSEDYDSVAVYLWNGFSTIIPLNSGIKAE